ncbi:formin-H [Callorhinchus milii]|uniref:Formin-H-like n=1 Tax=Callorhinchus milii TaxID=7868 RepID=A0A4W3IQ27_CALMI|nr:formin-H [Callorhinchus milii]|eukprot:gi/632939491/ref/XP_007910263.1/ PREDICTED: formin-H-like [Callorhinchus milii]
MAMDLSSGSGNYNHQLSNEEQIWLLNAVKNQKITVERAWEIAQTMKQPAQDTTKQEQLPEYDTQYNFCIYKYNRYRWQKRVLQIDFTSRILCNIAQGIIKKQFSFKNIKSCEHIDGQKISISFLGHHDYEVEATSAEDRVKIVQLVNQIIQSNIYEIHKTSKSGGDGLRKQPGVIKEGQLELQKGGLASMKWRRYCVRLTLAELCFQRLNPSEASELLGLAPNVIHLSDGYASVHKEMRTDSFTVITKKNCYLFKIPEAEHFKVMDDLRKCRDEWIDAIDKCCLHWKRISQSQLFADNNLYEAIENLALEMESTGESALKEPGSSRELSMEKDETKVEEKAENFREEIKKAVKEKKGSESLAPVKERTPRSPFTPSVLPIIARYLPPPPPPIPLPPPFPCKGSETSVKTKVLHWEVVAPEKIPKSIWGHSNSTKVQLNSVRLLDQFAIQDTIALKIIVNDFSPHQQILLNQKVAHNFNIFLKSFPVKATELNGKLLILQEENGGLTDEHITSLSRYVPTPDDVEKYKSYSGRHSDLHIVDQYMMTMCHITYLRQRLDLIVTVRELPVSMRNLQPLLNHKIKACSQLLESRMFVSVLGHLLAIGNFLNENARKEKIKGFRLSSLTKLVEIRGKDRTFTVLHALIEQIMLQEPALTTFTQELTEFEAVPGASIKGLIAEVDVLKNQLEKINQYKKIFKSKNKVNADREFYKELKSLIQKYEAELIQLSKQCDEMKKLYSDVLVKFGEPQNQDSQEMFGWISSFVNDFSKACADKKALQTGNR